VSVTLEESNLMWLRGQARVTSAGNVSQALDRLITSARTSSEARPVRSVAGTVRLPPDDPGLTTAKAAVRALFAQSLSRPMFVRDTSEPYGAVRSAKRQKPAARKPRG
jgi:hypothetical protein